MKEQLSTAIALAAFLHKDQFDLGGMPYICHPLAVMVSLDTEDQELMAIAVMHDLMEDCGLTIHEMKETHKFSDRIISGVVGMSKLEGELVNEFLTRAMRNIDVVRVKIDDLDHNMKPSRLKGFRDKDRVRMNKYIYMYRILRQFLRHGFVPADYWLEEFDSIPA